MKILFVNLHILTDFLYTFFSFPPLTSFVSLSPHLMIMLTVGSLCFVLLPYLNFAGGFIPVYRIWSRDKQCTECMNDSMGKNN